MKTELQLELLESADDVGPLMTLCPECCSLTYVKVEDYSFGYEFGSQSGTYHDYDVVTICCEVKVGRETLI